MNSQIRRLFTLVLALFAVMGLALTYIQFFEAPKLLADSRNTRQYIQASEQDRGPIVVAGEAVALSEKTDEGTRYTRLYPQGPTYAPVTGYFSATNLSATGMEAAENRVLEGKTTQLFFARLQNMIAGKPRQGGGVELTLDPTFQQTAADSLGNRPGAVVMLDAKTGAVRALYSSPSYDPNPLASLDAAVSSEAIEQLEADPARPLDNRAIAGNRFAPGSTFKILTALAMLENGYSPGTEVEAPVSTTLPGTDTQVSNIHQMECGDGHPPLIEAFARSCNTPFVIAANDLPSGALQDITDRFGFGKPLSIPLAVTPSAFPEEMDAAQTAISAIGQFDVQVTPMQMAMVAQTVANEGVMMQPYLVDKIVDADNKAHATTQPAELRKPIRAHLAREMTEMMTLAVDAPYGTAQGLQNGRFSVAAKTGTAEAGENRTNGWVVGFAPADNPEVVFAVLLEGTASQPNVGSSDAIAVARALLEAGL